MRALGVDLGSKRIGIAVCDSAGIVATPYEVVVRSGDTRLDHRQIVQLADEVGAERIVVGLPLSLDGSIGKAAEAVLDEVDQLAAASKIEIETYDERFTTVTAERSLLEMKMKVPARRKIIDAVAAAVMLQGWLDGRAANTGGEAGGVDENG